ncbi:MAG: alanine racemase [Candidatus Woesearchaeota archaeon]|nr:alanine racemase [Candidatus Woesearchaeota archaeon]
MMVDAFNNIKKILEEKIKFDNGSFFHNDVKEAVNKKNFLLESAEKFGTPQYFLDEAKLKQRALFFMNTFKKYISNSEFFYAFKCNDLPFLIKTLKNISYNADVASLFELKLALKLGFDKIIFTGPGKENEELELAIKNNDKVILNIDNFDELERLAEILEKDKQNKKINVCIRLNPHDSVMEEWSKFGIELKELDNTIKKIKEHPQLKLRGFHFHCSWNCTPDKYVENIGIIGKHLKDNFSAKDISELEFIDVGGGFYPEGNALLFKDTDKGKILSLLNNNEIDPHSIVIENAEPLDNFGREISAALEKHIFPLSPSIKIYFEPGRFISMHSTTILTKVISIKNNGAIVDGGANMVGDFRFSEYSFAPLVNLNDPSPLLNKKTIYGPLCHPSDLWGYSFFGKNIKKGDVIAVLNQGDYVFSYASRFIKPAAPYIALTEENKFVVVKEKEKFEERYFGCKF